MERHSRNWKRGDNLWVWHSLNTAGTLHSVTLLGIKREFFGIFIALFMLSISGRCQKSTFCVYFYISNFFLSLDRTNILNPVLRFGKQQLLLSMGIKQSVRGKRYILEQVYRRNEEKLKNRKRNQMQSLKMKIATTVKDSCFMTSTRVLFVMKLFGDHVKCRSYLQNKSSRHTLTLVSV